MSLIGLDIGTTGCKAIIFDEQGNIIGKGAREYPILMPQPHLAEQDIEEVWHLSMAALREAVSSARQDPPITLALSVQGEAVVPVDKNCRPLRHAILGMDTRTTKENQWLEEQFGREHLFNRTGMPVHTINTLPKLLWLQKHEPGIWRAADKFLLYEDYFLRKLGGKAVISHCLASRTQMYDLENNDWADAILSNCQIERKRLSELAPAHGGIVGMIDNKLAADLGLPNNVLLVSGGHDQACAALGSGVIRAGLAMVSTGTAEVVEVAMDSPVLNETLYQGNISVYRHVVPGLFLAMTLNHSGGLLLRWFRNNFCEPQIEQGRKTGENPYDLILKDAMPGPTPLLALPHFAGSGTPLFDTSSKGAILGLTFATSRATIAKAILEGLTFELRTNLELLSKAGIGISELHAVGGGAKSPLWLQLKADICRIALRVPKVTEAACLGAALLAGVAAGKYKDLQSAAAQTVELLPEINFQEKSAQQYDKRYLLYRQVYPALKDLQHQL